MKIVSFRHNGGVAQPGVIVEDRVIGLTVAGFNSTLELIETWGSARAIVERHLQSKIATGVYPLKSVKLLAPVPRPAKVICVGLNYRDHAIESNMEIPKLPTIFNKFPQTVIGPGETIVLPKNS